jgi:hypothetical protein
MAAACAASSHSAASLKKCVHDTNQLFEENPELEEWAEKTKKKLKGKLEEHPLLMKIAQKKRAQIKANIKENVSHFPEYLALKLMAGRSSSPNKSLHKAGRRSRSMSFNASHPRDALGRFLPEHHMVALSLHHASPHHHHSRSYAASHRARDSRGHFVSSGSHHHSSHHSSSLGRSMSASSRPRDSHGRFLPSGRSSSPKSLHKAGRRSAADKKMELFLADVKTHRPHIHLKLKGDAMAWKKDAFLRQLFNERFPEYAM